MLIAQSYNISKVLPYSTPHTWSTFRRLGSLDHVIRYISPTFPMFIAQSYHISPFWLTYPSKVLTYSTPHTWSTFRRLGSFDLVIRYISPTLPMFIAQSCHISPYLLTHPLKYYYISTPQTWTTFRRLGSLDHVNIIHIHNGILPRLQCVCHCCYYFVLANLYILQKTPSKLHPPNTISNPLH